MRNHVAQPRIDDINMTAKHCNSGRRSAGEHRSLQFPDVHATGPQAGDQRGVIGPAQTRGDAEAGGLGIFFQQFHQIPASPDRRLGAHVDAEIFLEQHRQRGERSVVVRNEPQDVIADRTGGGHNHVVTVAWMLVQVIQADGAATAWFIDNIDRDVDQLVLSEDFRDHPRGAVRSAPGT